MNTLVAKGVHLLTCIKVTYQGDEDQSIYGFRAAYPEAVLSFATEHRNAKVLLMEQNFRSTGNIIRCASEFIKKNTERHPKNMITTNEDGKAITDIVIKKRASQYSYLVKAANDAKGQIAVLYRDNESALPLVDAFERNNIPYNLMGNAKEFVFFSNKIVVDIINIIRFAYDTYNVEIFMQIYYKINTYLKKDDAIKICRLSEERNLPILDAALEYDGLSGNVYGAIKGVRTNLANLKTDKADKVIYRILNTMGYSNYLERSGITDSKSYILATLGAEEESAMRLLFRLEELQEIILNKEYDKNAKIMLSTIHSSKGLEYDTVYVIDVEDGLFPEEYVDPASIKYLSKDKRKSYEEERRLFYVAITRARKNLNLFSLPCSSFCREALGKNKPVMPEKRPAGKASYNAFNIYKDSKKTR